MYSTSVEPFYFAGGSTGCLLIHGFSGSPAEVRQLGEFLAMQGCTVRGVRLAGHGSTPEDLRRTRWRDWLQSVEEGFTSLREQCETVVVVGFSLGGALALLLARRRSFERLVLLATPMELEGDWRLRLLPVARFVIPWYYPLENADRNDPLVQQRIREFVPDADLFDPETWNSIRRSVKIPVAAIYELQKVLRYAKVTALQVQIPTLVMHGSNDETIHPRNASQLFTRLGSSEKRLVWLEQSGHQLLTISPERQHIYEQVVEFVIPESAVSIT